jgi:hypothetical protein
MVLRDLRGAPGGKQGGYEKLKSRYTLRNASSREWEDVLFGRGLVDVKNLLI